MRIKFTRDTNHNFKSARAAFYKKDGGVNKDGVYTVPHEFGLQCVKDGSGVEVTDKKTSSNAPNKPKSTPAKAPFIAKIDAKK